MSFAHVGNSWAAKSPAPVWSSARSLCGQAPPPHTADTLPPQRLPLEALQRQKSALLTCREERLYPEVHVALGPFQVGHACL